MWLVIRVRAEGDDWGSELMLVLSHWDVGFGIRFRVTWSMFLWIGIRVWIRHGG